ncbi:uncharacterized protein LOC115219476 [Octopus sinensis]|uniref:Uncharacterized protein LOC115219476 n=1 Tax=Octopus sinensis TaxID=2607531 RepID=A0A6P7T6Q7_9MOLL|nr:uncharacterized protein LOC115219476 [Octopus sinensis]
MKSFICVVLILCFSSIHTQKLSTGDAALMNELSIVQYNAASYYRYVSQYFHATNLFGFKKFFMKLSDLKSENAKDIFLYISGRIDPLTKPHVSINTIRFLFIDIECKPNHRQLMPKTIVTSDFFVSHPLSMLAWVGRFNWGLGSQKAAPGPV